MCHGGSQSGPVGGLTRLSSYVGDQDIDVRYSEHMDYQHPIEAVIPGSTGRLLAALARVETELPISTLATVAGVGRTRASTIIADLHHLGLVHRREIGRTTLVALARDNAAGELIDRLGHLRGTVLDGLRSFASEINPPPVTLAVFGSFARGEADADSDVDVLAIRPAATKMDAWSDAISIFTDRARQLTGNPVQVLYSELEEFQRKASLRAEVGRAFWSALRRDAIVLAGAELADLLLESNVASR
jgi:predicted nucleotidyltransferase